MAGPAHVALIGFGEVGSIFATGLRERGVERITAFDLLFADADSRPSRAARTAGIEACGSAVDAAMGAGLVISAVTAAQAGAAARSVIGGIGQGAFFLDLNSASPGVKVAAAAEIDAAGGRYVEAAVMSPAPPKGLKTPMLLGGPHARDFLDYAAALALEAKVFSDTVGPASATKMCRSVMIKGVEALLAESLLTARHYGVEGTVLDSLSDLLPHPDWRRQAAYMISRSLVHGRRRAEEMREVAVTVAEAGVEPLMSRSIAERQDWASVQGVHMDPGAWEALDIGRMLDAIRTASALKGESNVSRRAAAGEGLSTVPGDGAR